MRGAVAGFWAGVFLMTAVFAAAGSTTLDLRVTGTEASKARLEQDVDQGALAGLLSAEPAIGVLHIRKRSWGIVTTYFASLAVPGAGTAGVPDLRVRLTLPGSVTASNAAGRDGRTLVWTGLPGADPAWADSRAVNWPVIAAGIAAAGVSLRMRGRA